MGCPGVGGGSRAQSDILSQYMYARFLGQKRIVMEKKDRFAVFGCNDERLFPDKYTLKFYFRPKSTGTY